MVLVGDLEDDVVMWSEGTSAVVGGGETVLIGD
jgi:hypothetical protein